MLIHRNADTDAASHLMDQESGACSTHAMTTFTDRNRGSVIDGLRGVRQSDRFSLPEVPDHVMHSSVKDSTRLDADIIVMLNGKEWNEWRNRRPQVAQYLTEHLQKDGLCLEKCQAVDSPDHSIAIKFDRRCAVPLILQQHCDFVDELESRTATAVRIVSVKKEANGWISRRIDAIAATLSAGSPVIEVTASDMDQNQAEAQFQLLADELKEFLDPESHVLRIDDMVLKPESNVIPAIADLKQILPSIRGFRTILVVHHSLVTAFSRAVRVLSLLSEDWVAADTEIVAVAHVKCDQDVDEYCEWLKRYISTQALSEEDLSNGAGDAETTEKVLKLFQTGILFSLLSKGPSERLVIDESAVRGYLFVQYNFSRINEIIKKFEIEYQGHDPDLVDLRQLDSDKEWILVYKHMQQFIHLMEQEPVSRMRNTVHYLMSLSKDLSKYYSKTRILVKEKNEQTIPLTVARVSLLKAIHRIYIHCLKVLSVQPVDRM